MQAILGQKLSADINLIAQGAILIGLWIGFYFAHKRKISVHRRIQTSMVLANIFFIALIMVTSFYNYVIRGKTTTGIVAGLMIAHGIAGLVAELTGIYLILRMNTGLIPARLRVRNYKLVMRLLLGLWTLVAIGGFGIYVVRYVAPPPNESAAAGKLLQAADNLSLHAGEMQEALRRNDLPAARRHAEHLINLIEGKHGADYGDADGDGIVEDPGDGMGALPYLDQVLAISGKPADLPSRSQQAVSELRSKILKVLVDAQAVIQSNDLSSVNGQINETVALTGQIKNGPSGSVQGLIQALNLTPVISTAVLPAVNTGGQGSEVILKDFTFVPKTIRVKKGETIIFINQDAEKHTVTSDAGLFDSGDLLPGQSYSHTFDQTGTFPYYCVFHGDKGGIDMAGVIEVEP